MTGPKKLSSLQKQILILALPNKAREDRPYDSTSGADVSYTEILASVYGFEPCVDQYFDERHGGHAGKRKFGSLFSVPPRKSMRHEPPVSRAMLRLQSRGLMQCMRGGYWAGRIH